MTQAINVGKRIRRLRERIPTFQCREGCSACCGMVPWSNWEWAQVKDKRIQDTETCPYVSEKGCQCYSDRPLMCRLFGAVDDPRLRCPHGCGPDKPLTQAEAHEIMDEYIPLIDLEG